TASSSPAATSSATPNRSPSTDATFFPPPASTPQHIHAPASMSPNKRNVAMLDMRQVTKVYRTELVETHALRSLDLHVKEGEFVAVTGPSGSGKTTFLNIAGLLETFTGGEYHLDGQDVRGLSDDQRSKLRNQKIGFIFQSFNLIPDLNLFDNVDVPLRYRGMNAAERKGRIGEALAKAGLVSPAGA